MSGQLAIAAQAFFLFFLGTLLGSYLQVIADRWVEKIKKNQQRMQVGKRSVCPNCGKQLSWQELFPLLSFIFQRGRCRGCKISISARYPIVELTMGFFVLALGWQAGVAGPELVMLVLQIGMVALLLILFLIDLDTMYLPDQFVLGLLLIVVTSFFVIDYQSLIPSLAGAAVGVGVPGLIWLLSKGRGIGLGDVKLMLPLGLYFGLWDTVVLLWLAFVVGGLVGIWLLLKKKVELKTAIPFGPFLIGAALLLLLQPGLASTLLNYLLYGIR